ncbi:MAG: lipoyl synthase [Bdellovibrionales bacterium]|nr:lipoyl synthase [Bdellovibrionales bacterium]
MSHSSSVNKMKPSWLKVPLPTGKEYFRIRRLLKSLDLVTVCQEAHCPNMAECWGGGTATIMLMGDVCTRGCRFCNVKTGNPKGSLDQDEPIKVAKAISKMGLEYVVLTSVDRDDLPDEGAGHFAKTIRHLKNRVPDLLIEVLTPDFKGRRDCVKIILSAGPDVFAHNVETVERLTPRVRDPRAGYRQSLNVLEMSKEEFPRVYTKSSIMLGLGETDEEVKNTLKDLRSVDCDVVTFGQYLRPRKRHLPVEEYVTPEKFNEWKEYALQIGFLYVASGPLVRSSYRAGELFMKALLRKEGSNGKIIR